MSKLIDKRFGRLVILGLAGKNKWRNYQWLCKCDCGKEIIATISNLRSEKTQSCGCLRKEIVMKTMTVHGHFKNRKMTGIYNSWCHMIQRCTNPNNKRYKDYGGRGITICDRWLKFENFNEDMGKSWKPGLMLERRKNELGYFKDNCHWATRKEQQRDRRNNRLITAFSKTQIMIEWAEETGIPYQVIRWRLNNGWPKEKALTELVGKYKKRKNG